MAELKKIASQLKNAADELLGQVKEIDHQIAGLAKQRDALTSGIVTKADFMEYLRGYIHIKAGFFGKEVSSALKARRDFGSLEYDRIAGNGFPGILLLTAIMVPVVITEKALYFYFGDVILARLSQALDALDWPDNAIPVALRHEQLVNIENETAELYRQRAELVSMLGEVGITGI